ncbi:lysophospholipid acyltransferase family protein [Lentzea flava]|uniref:1-acyl-sn-glycerol-3-phosphate acyltransferase n=1 Tax=Lentzea flava TaxID=103732 RepID=A0ABQ2UY75_9PSEU|nr:lysophospholipid acyltransferase family protein [Lentzea flava]MCP2202449.1 1-acyl-sn-glycerol-3-phosphate acyltransferase [Lentzea flava]GGU59152.1 1-acyl-sn-glycerol-3-phosphate acyltransferase [Lentzea flava]
MTVPEGSLGWLFDFGRWIARVPYAWQFRIRVHGRDRVPLSGGVVVVANHSSMADGPILFGVLPRRVTFLIKQEMFKGVVGYLLRKIGQIPVKRGEADRTALTSALSVLKAGGVVGIFPEGTRGEGDVASAQNGAAWLARVGGAVVLPVACRGTYQAKGWRPPVDVLIGEPFHLPEGKGKAALGVATEQVRDRLATLVAELDELRVSEERR